MDLFNNSPNMLPFDGEAIYMGSILPFEKAQQYFDQLLNSIAWEHDKAIIFNKLIVCKRKVAWYGDKAYEYGYSNTIKSALPWTKELLELKKMVEQQSGETFNSCLLNLYHSGAEGMAWHRDNEVALKKEAAIASLSLGAARKFSFKHKDSKQTVSVLLEPGSLLIMKGDTQSHWLHCLPPTKKVKTPRINLTFRTIATQLQKKL